MWERNAKGKRDIKKREKNERNREKKSCFANGAHKICLPLFFLVDLSNGSFHLTTTRFRS